MTLVISDHKELMPHRNTFFAFLEGNKYVDIAEVDETALGPSTTLMHGYGTTGNALMDEELGIISPMMFSPNATQEQMLQLFKSSLAPAMQRMQVPLPLRAHGNWLQFLPPLTGSNLLLDTAVRAVGLAHVGTLHGSDRFLAEARPYYGSALRMLNSAIQDVDTGMSNETLSATMLLSFYEMFAGENNDSWIRHAGGAGALMKIRGPNRHRYGFEREIFMAYRHTIIIEALHKDEACFLKEPEWLQLARDIHEDMRKTDIAAAHMDLFDLAERFYELMLDMPTLMYEARNLRIAKEEQKDKFATTKAFKDDLLHRSHECRSALKTFFTQFEHCLARIGYVWTSYVSGDHVVPIYYDFPNVFISSTCNGYWTVLLVLNGMLMELERSSSSDRVEMYRVECHDLATEICRATAYQLTSSFIGPFFTTFALRACIPFLRESEARTWVIEKLFEIGSTHMSMAKHIPGFAPGAGLPRVRAELAATARLEELGEV